MKRKWWAKVVSVLLTMSLMVACAVTGASALGGNAYAEKLTDLLDVELSGDVATDVENLLNGAKLYNLLIVGVDSRQNDYEGRSDAMMILTVNPVEKKLVLTSLLRDSYVSIPGNGQDRLNAAYDLGGISLLKKTIRQNYGIKPDGYVVVNFNDLIDFVNDIGGVEMTVTKAEVRYINTYTASQNKELYGKKTNPDALPEKGGTLHLNGMQALAYARIRYVGLDFGRTERQRKVISASLRQLFSQPVNTQVSVLAKYFSRVKTDVTVPELLYLVLVYATIDRYETKSMALPAEGTYSNKSISGKDVLKVDFAANRALWADAVGA